MRERYIIGKVQSKGAETRGSMSVILEGERTRGERLGVDGERESSRGKSLDVNLLHVFDD